ncbi:MAG: DUF2231 domain-containing protein [Caulobacteraceae bacterium]
MRLHPLHPISVHAPVACILFTPLADLGAHLSQRNDAWTLGVLTSAGAVIFGVLAAMFGALDFERARAKAPRTVIAHACVMLIAVTFSAASLMGRIDQQFAIAAPPPFWSIVTSVASALAMMLGAYLGGELVYRHGVNVRAEN